MGYPVAHSISPQMQNAEFAKLGLKWTVEIMRNILLLHL
ncbi:MAG: hypothetical protein WCO98_09620 [bacterium]